MKRLSVIVTGFLVLMPLCVLAQDIKTISRVTEVTVYPGAALVTRQAQIDLPIGDHTLFLEDIVPYIDENTLTVKGKGSAQVKIFGASIKTDHLTQSSNERVKLLESQIESLDDQMLVERSRQENLKKQREYLESVKLFSAGQITKDLVTKTPAVADLEQVGAYIAKGFSDLSIQAEDIRLKLRVLERQKDALTRQLQELNSQQGHVKRSIAVDVEVLQPGGLSLAVSYLVGNVNWEALYDARVVFDKAQLDLSLFGLISQSSGEDWKDVQLTISTSRPSLGGVMPELSPWTLRPWQPQPAMLRSRSMAKMKKDGLAGGAMNEMKEEADMMVASAPMDAQMAYAQVQERGTTAVFRITKPVSIKSDGSQQRIPISSLNLPVQFEYATTPKLAAYAYLRSEVENTQAAVLLPGRVNIFLDGDYVGVSVIPKAIGQKEKFDLYLGADEGVSVKRELVEQKSDDVLFGGIPSPSKTDRYSYKIKVENYKTRAIKVNVFDHIPVSQDEKIKVKDLKYAPEPTRKDFQDRKGVLLWTLDLNPQAKKEISYSYAVERPRDMNIEGL